MNCGRGFARMRADEVKVNHGRGLAPMYADEVNNES